MTTGGADDDRGRTLSISLTPDEALVLVNALNEVCNGIEIEDWEFTTRLGADREEARALLARLGRLVDEP